MRSGQRGLQPPSALVTIRGLSPLDSLQQETVSQPVSRGWPQIYFGIAATSLATLLLELALTRIFSVVYFYHFAFLAISIALFGLGAGGVFSYVVAGWPRIVVPENRNARSGERSRHRPLFVVSAHTETTTPDSLS